MRKAAFASILVLLCGVLLFAQAPAPAAQPAVPSSAEAFPVRRVVLYKAGVGYFEHLGRVRNNQDIAIRFTSAQLNDVLKSLTAIDLGKGLISSISYNSVAPLEQRLGALRLPLDQATTMLDLLGSLRGARVEVSSGGATVTGRLLSVEQRSQRRGDQVETVQIFSIVTDGGEMRTFELNPAVRVRLADADLRREVGRFLDVLGSTREQDVRTMVISTTGTGERSLFVSYVSEVPIWKSTYRLVVPSKGRPLLQGWAIVDNTIGEDWQNVELSLVAGAPQSFIQQLSQPYYGRRPVVPLPQAVMLDPQTHAGTLQSRGTLRGTVRDQSGAVIPGATVRLIGPSGEIGSTHSDQAGAFEIAAPPGAYTMLVQLAGFRNARIDGVALAVGGDVTQNIVLAVGALSEAVSVTMDGVASGARGGRGGTIGGLPGPPPPPPPAPRAKNIYDQLQQLEVAATGAELGELFEYQIKEPVTLRKNQSALVPIINAEINAEKVSLWNRNSGNARPFRAMWLTNTSGLTLDGGSITFIDGDAFAGEGLIEPLKPGEKRLVSYAADLAMRVSAGTESAPRRIFRIRAREGILIQDTEDSATWTYKVRNEGQTQASLIIEHPLRSGWKLAAGQSPVESTATEERFRVVVEAGAERTLVVKEIHAGVARVSIGDINEALITQLTTSGVDAEALVRALKPVLDKRSELAAIDRRLRDLESQRNRIVQDQTRLRENMKALRGSAEEKQLLQRYTRQLDEQETKLASLQQDIDRATAERDVARAELSRLIGSVTFELSGKS